MTELALINSFAPVKEMEYLIKPLGDGVQILFRFANGAGVSVVRHSGSYGSFSGLFEAAPIFYLDAGWENWDFIGLAFDLPGFANRDDVEGHLSFSGVDEIIAMVASL